MQDKPTLSVVRNTPRRRTPPIVCLKGVDNTVRFENLITLQKRYPFASFGIRFAPPGELSAGVPNAAWRTKAECRASRTETSILAFLDKGRTEELLSGALRESDNGCNTKHYKNLILSPIDPHVLRAEKVRFPEHRHVVFETPMDPAFFLELAGPSTFGNVSFLFDVTAGTGIYRKFWPAMPPGYRIGITGGISQHNIGVVLANLAPEVSWISVDQGTHTSDGLFSMAAAEAVLRQVADYYAPDASFP